MQNLSTIFDELKKRKFLAGLALSRRTISGVLLLVLLAAGFSSCGSEAVDLRSLAPKDAIIYLETNDLGKTLQALTESEAFKQNSESALDFSAVEGFQIAIAVTGFETSEKQVTQQQSVLNFKPKFVAIAETNAWSWQIDALVNGVLNNFFRKIYGEDVRMDVETKNELDWFSWSSTDGRKTFAVVSGSQIFLGNDEESIKKCLSAKRGESESLLENETLSLAYQNKRGDLAFGFIGNEGVKQIADLAGVLVAVRQTEDENVRGFISRILPQMLKNTTKEITWTANKIEKGIEDTLFIRTEKKVSDVFSETIVTADKDASKLYERLPLETVSLTRYNLKNPQIAYRSFLLLSEKSTDPLSGKLIAAFSNSLLEPYGVSDAETFLSAVDSNIISAQIDSEGEKSIVLAKITNEDELKKSITKGIDFAAKPLERGGGKIWTSKAGDLALAIFGDLIVMGDSEGVTKSMESYTMRNISPLDGSRDLTKSPPFNSIRISKTVSSTLYKDFGRVEKMVKVLGKSKGDRVKETSRVVIKTRFDKSGIERNYVSDFGFIGTLIEQFDN